MHVNDRTALRIFAPAYVLAAAVIGGFALAREFGGSFEALYVGHLLPWLITVWIGAGFSCTWELVARSAEASRAPRGVVAATGVLSAIVLFVMLGGVSALRVDPSLFGIAIWPGLRLAVPWVRSRLTSGPQPETPR